VATNDPVGQSAQPAQLAELVVALKVPAAQPLQTRSFVALASVVTY
jgi:hypothetical protein